MTSCLWTGLQETFDFHTAAGEASETWPRTVFVLAGVQGIDLGERGGIGAQGTLSEHALHVPLVVRHPDSLTGERIFGDVVQLEDVMPTLLDWFRLPTPAGLRGRSLLARLDSYVKRPFDPLPAFAQLPERGVFSVRTQRWHLVWNALRAEPAGRPSSSPPLAAVALYEPELDPDEFDDVSARHPEVVAELTAAIRAWREAQVLFPSELRPAPR
jgi:arylsulfatase A-like enzyme